jgi:SSS family solute:Na+ symporter
VGFLLRWLDLGVVGAYLPALTSLGLGYARDQNTTERYFLARRAIPAGAIAMSLLATLTTTVAFLAYLASSSTNRWSLLVPVWIAAALLVSISSGIVPFYRRAVGMSAYEYFGQRFGRAVQTYAGAAYVVGHASIMAFVLYLLGRTAAGATGWTVDRIILIVGILTVAYTLLGGLEAVIWTSVLQGYVLLACGLAALAYLFIVPGARHRFPLRDWSAGWNGPAMLAALLVGVVWCLQKFTADQAIVQRYLAAPSDRSAVSGVRMAALLCAALPALLMLPAGAGILRLPYVRSGHVPPGAAGLVLSALLGSAMCAFASDLNSFALVGVEGIYRHWQPDAGDRARLALGKSLVLLCGAACIAGALELAHARTPALATALNLSAAGIGGLAGIFVLAFLSDRASRRGVWAGIVASLAFTAWTALSGNTQGPLSPNPWHDPWMAAASPAVLISIGYIASFLWPDPATGKVTGMTLWHWLRWRKTTVHET